MNTRIGQMEKYEQSYDGKLTYSSSKKRYKEELKHQRSVENTAHITKEENSEAAVHSEVEFQGAKEKFIKQQKYARGIMLSKLRLLEYYNMSDPHDQASYLPKMRKEVVPYYRHFSESLRSQYDEE